MWYISDLSVLSQFKKSALPPIWNAFFTIMFKCFSERSTGSDNASRLFHTLLYGLYTGENIDFGTILWDQFVQSPASKTKDIEISRARFWSIMVRNAMLHYHIPEIRDVVIADIPKMKTSMFVTFEPKNFLIVGLISQSMLSMVPAGNPVIIEYLKTAVPTGDIGSDSIHEEEIPKKKVL
ncbi:unnamed protein product [Lactuca virosa]|uniref:Uncharacterized protein n=1 Tax=Lactuca virosa TaxID=75947 RepID=A0AAU9NI48_9ASTR|nr:unnamed protein product [Lactuca virosa]